MVKILCLHGSGTSARIYEHQTDALRKLLPSHWQYHFQNWPMSCGPLDQVEGIFPGPYFCPYDMPNIMRIQELYEWYLDVIDEHGPFDGVIGFSAGAYVTHSFLLHRQMHEPSEPPLFSFAVFIAGNTPFAMNPDDGVEITEWMVCHKQPPSAILSELIAHNEYMAEHPDDHPDPLDPVGLPTFIHELQKITLTGEFDRRNYHTRMLHPDTISVRTEIPTVHIVGKKDKVYRHGLNQYELCIPSTRTLFEHDGSHEVPRSKSDLMRIKALIEKAAFRAQCNC